MKVSNMTIIGGIISESEDQDSGYCNSPFSRLNSQRSIGSLSDITELFSPSAMNMFAFEEPLDTTFCQDNSSSTTTTTTTTAPLEFTEYTIKKENVSPVTSPQDDMQSLIGIYTSVNQYDSQTIGMNDIKGEPALDPAVENQRYSMNSDGNIEMGTYQKTPEVESSSNSDVSVPELQARINKACRTLNLPKNPWIWTVDEVNKWLNCVVVPYYGIDTKSSTSFPLQIDGNTLCMISSKQSCNTDQNPAIQAIFAEIGLWINCWSCEEQEKEPYCQVENTVREHAQCQLYQQQQQQQQHDQQQIFNYNQDSCIYTDISQAPVIVSNTMIQSQFTVTSPYTTTSLPTIPTPVSTHSSHNTHNMSLTLNEYQHATALSSFPPHMQQPQQVSPTTSGSSSPTWASSGSDGYNSSFEEESRGYSPVPNVRQYTAAVTARGTLPHSRNSIKLWQFLRNLLDQPTVPGCISWLDREKGIFKIEDSQKVAKMWGQRKNRPAMNYDKLSRSIRQYYKKGIIKKTDNSKRLVYQFCTPYL